jgi:hypothetical protein
MASLVTVHVFFDQSEALVAKSLLESQDLYAVLPDWHHVTNAWHLTVALQGIRLCTLDIHAEEARALLGNISEPKVDNESRRIGDMLLAAVAMLIAGIPHPIRRRRRWH